MIKISKSNEEIKQDIIDELYWDYSVDPSNIKVKVKDGMVILNGSVPSYREKASAELDVKKIEGVLSVENNIEIEFLKEFEVPYDEVIKNNIETALSSNSGIDSKEIEVSVNEGEVILKGNINAYWKKIKAERLASEIKGVKDVKNKISVFVTETYSDEKIEKNIRSALKRSRLIYAKNVNIEVNNGKVKLKGRVANWGAYNIAENAAVFTRGVTDIENDIIIQLI